METKFLTAKEIREAIVSRKVTAREVAEAVLSDIKLRDGEFHAFIETFDEDALRQADAIDAKIAAGEELPSLAGVPVAIKDNMLYAGHIAAAGSRILFEYQATYTATVVERLIAAGAIIIGRTNMDDAAMGSSTETSVHGPSMNPWDSTRVPGGSSGGSASAVSAGFVPLALGSDTGGSIRQPAAFTGIIGLKPTYGRVSRFGLIAMASSFDQIGAFARTTDDLMACMRVIEGRDERDATSVDLPETSIVPAPDLKGLKVGVPNEFFIDGLNKEIKIKIEESIARLKDLGAEIVDISLPLFEAALPAYYIIQPAEVSSNLGRLDGLRYGTRAPGTLEESYIAARGAGFGTEVKRRILLGTFILSAGYYDSFYKKGLAVRNALKKEMDEAFKKVDVIVGPTAPSPAWKLGGKGDDPIAMYLEDIFTVVANVIGIPAISVPCGFVDDLPVGFHVQTKVFNEAALYRVANAFLGDKELPRPSGM